MRLVLELLPAIITAVKGIEEALPEDGLGKTKLALVVESLQSVTEGMAEYLPTIEKVITAVVNVFNRAGLFQHK